MTNNQKDKMLVVIPFLILSFLLIGSICVEFKLLDIIYFISLMICVIKYLIIKKQNKNEDVDY